jgi:hypothetical protein
MTVFSGAKYRRTYEVPKKAALHIHVILRLSDKFKKIFVSKRNHRDKLCYEVLSSELAWSAAQAALVQMSVYRTVYCTQQKYGCAAICNLK